MEYSLAGIPWWLVVLLVVVVIVLAVARKVTQGKK